MNNKAKNKNEDRLPLSAKEIKRQIYEVKHPSSANSPVSFTGEGCGIMVSLDMDLAPNDDMMFKIILFSNKAIRCSVYKDSKAFETFMDMFLETKEPVLFVTYTITAEKGMTLDTVEVVEDYDPYVLNMYLESPYALNFNMQCALKECQPSLNALNIIKKATHMDSGDDFMRELINGYASSSFNSAYPGGLIEHIYNCLYLYASYRVHYPWIFDRRTNDLMVIGIVLHDIGKVYNLEWGYPRPESQFNHQLQGILHLEKFKDLIVETYDEEFYDMLFSIIGEHHKGKRRYPTTVYALLFRFIDGLERHSSVIISAIEEGNIRKSPFGLAVNMNDESLLIMEPDPFDFFKDNDIEWTDEFLRDKLFGNDAE